MVGENKKKAIKSLKRMAGIKWLRLNVKLCLWPKVFTAITFEVLSSPKASAGEGIYNLVDQDTTIKAVS